MRVLPLLLCSALAWAETDHVLSDRLDAWRSDLQAPRAELRLAALDALGRSGHVAARGWIAERLRAGVIPVSEMPAACIALERLGADDASRDTLRTLLVHADPAVRLAAIHVLNRFAALSEADLMAHAADADRDVRRTCLLHLASRGGNDALPVLAVGTRDSDPVVRRYCLQAIGRLKGTSQTDAVLAALDDGNAGVRGAAALVVADLGRSDQVARLLLSFEADMAADAMATAVRRLTGVDLGWRPGMSDLARRAAVERGHAWIAEQLRLQATRPTPAPADNKRKK